MLALITWLGFRQEFIEYDKQPRAAGRSGWTLARKIKLVVDSVTAFSEAPIRACTLLGLALLAVAAVPGRRPGSCAGRRPAAGTSCCSWPRWPA